MPLEQFPSDEAIRNTVRDVLGDGTYHIEIQEEETLGWLKALWEALKNLFFPSQDSSDGFLEGSWQSYLVAGVLLLAFIAVATQLVKMFLARRRQGKQLSKQKPAPVSSRPDELEQMAAEAAERESYVEAIRLLLRAAALRIAAAEQRIMRPGISNRELLRQYRGTPLFNPLRELVQRVNEKWFGVRSCSVTDFSTCREAVEEIKSLASRPKRDGTLQSGTSLSATQLHLPRSHTPSA